MDLCSFVSASRIVVLEGTYNISVCKGLIKLLLDSMVSRQVSSTSISTILSLSVQFSANKKVETIESHRFRFLTR